MHGLAPTEDMLPAYVKIANGAAPRTLLAANQMR
jgi:hypothetical protein